MSFLEIDTLMSRVQLFCHAPDYKSALEDLKIVEQLCTEFPDKNESTLCSAVFQMGKCEMDLQRHEAAKVYFDRTIEMLRTKLKSLSMVASNGSAQSMPDSVEEMVKPSIFDTDEIKATKGIMLEVQEYIAEIQYTSANKETLEKEKEAAKKS